MAAITILHVSDVHFGETDLRREQPNITNRLVEKARAYGDLPGFRPDLCIFSGDLTFKGDEEEFKSGEAWLKDLLEPWPMCRLFVVPGNHEVVRPTKANEETQAIRFLHGENSGGLDENAYDGLRQQVSGWGLLTNFRQWHESARDPKRLPWLISDWSADLYGCRWQDEIRGLEVRIIGLNTALLSCEKDEQGKLVADVRY